MKRREPEPDPGEASLPEGWRTLSYASRRELMRGARIPADGGIVGERVTIDERT